MSDSDKYKVDVDFLTCPICLELYVDPVLLQCYHTFCKSCVKQLTGKSFDTQVQCPLCRVVVPCSDVDSLKRNLYVESHLTFHKAPDNRTCEICECESNVDWKCVDCDQILCNSCYVVHSKLRLSRHHEVISYNQQDHKVRLVKETYCSKHRNEILRFLCVKCNIPVCRDCKLTVHEGHQSRDIADMVSDAKKWAKKRTDSLVIEENALKKNIQNARNWKQEIGMNMKSAAREIDKLERQLHQKVSEECEILKNELLDERKTTFKTIYNYSTKVNAKLQSVSNMNRYTEQVFKIGSDADMIQCKDDTDNFDALNIEVEDKVPYNINIIKRQPIQIRMQEYITINSQPGIQIVEKERFNCEDALHKIVTSICLLEDGHGFVAFRYINISTNSRQQKMLHSYTSSGQLTAVHALPQQLDISVNKNNKILWYDEERRKIYLYPPSAEGENKPLKENCIRPMAIKVAQNGDVICLHTNKQLTRNFEDVMDTWMLDSPMFIACIHDNIWITDPGKGQIVIINAAGNVKSTINASDFLSLPGKFCPHGICHSYKHKCVFVSDTRNNCIIVVSESGDFCFLLLDQDQGLQTPTCLATKENSLWVCDKDTRITVYEI